MSTTDYTNRTVDLLFATNWNEQTPFRIMNSLDNAQVCTGVQKVAQTFALLLLTGAGSIKQDPTFGTDFIDAVSSVYNEVELTARFQLAVNQIKSYLRNNVPAPSNADEQFVSAELLSIQRLPDSLKLVVRINTAAADNRSIVVPLGVAIV